MADFSLPALADRIGLLHERTTRAAAQRINAWLTIRNWLIGCYLVEYEQQGSDRAAYGSNLLVKLAERLKGKDIKGLSAPGRSCYFRG